MKVWIVWDPLHERVVSAHKTEEGANKRRIIEDEKDDKIYGAPNYYIHNYNQFELED